MSDYRILVDGRLTTIADFQSSRNPCVEGTLSFPYDAIPNLPEGLTVSGNLELVGSNITNLPRGLRVHGTLNLAHSTITELPSDLFVGEHLILYKTGIAELPEGLHVGGEIGIRGTKITKFPQSIIGRHDVPFVPDIDLQLWNILNSVGYLDMSDWHRCETTHCRGGWAIKLAGERGEKLEREVGSLMAAAMIYQASRPDQGFPDFFAGRLDALSDIQRGAEAQRSILTISGDTPG